MVLFRKSKDVVAAEVPTRNVSQTATKTKPKSILKAPDSKNAILWCSISRDQVTMARTLTNPPHPDAPRLSQEVLKAPATTGWEFFSFGQDEYKPGFRGKSL